ncbi:MAG: hypothetical protein KF796_19470 [Ramlibacter sp.]|nr:hypothetical protein [Ramlibacter sp.]
MKSPEHAFQTVEHFVEITVRAKLGTYETSALRKQRASCTAGEQQAAEALGRKVFGVEFVRVEPFRPATVQHGVTFWHIYYRDTEAFIQTPRLKTRPDLLRQWLDDVTGTNSPNDTVVLPRQQARMWAEDAIAAHELAAACVVAAKAHPTQPTVLVRGVRRFKSNAIVAHLLDHGGINMDDLARLPFSDEDRRQFAQLIGFSVSGYQDLDYAQRDPQDCSDSPGAGEREGA